MSSVTEKAAILADCARERLVFYSRWYSEHTFLDTVTGFASESSRSVRDALEPSAVGFISRHQGFFDEYVDPVLLSSPVKLFAGGMGGSAALFATMTLGLPGFIRAVAARETGIREILSDCKEALVAANSHVVSYATGGAPEEPFDRAFESAQVLGAAFLVLYGGKSVAGGSLRLARSLAKRAAGAAAQGGALVTAEGIVLGAGETAKGEVLSSSVTQGLKGPALLAAGAGSGASPSAALEALEKFRAMSSSKLLRISKTQRRLAAQKGKRRHLIKKMRAGEFDSSSRHPSSEMTAAQKRAFAQVLVERNMGREALRVVADWEHVEKIKASVARELAERGEKIRPATGPESVSKGIYSKLDDASLVRLAEEAGELLKKEAGRKTHVSRMWPDADPYVVNEIANLGESRGVLEILDLCRVRELASELALRGFADDAFVLEIRIEKAGH